MVRVHQVPSSDKQPVSDERPKAPGGMPSNGEAGDGKSSEASTDKAGFAIPTLGGGVSDDAPRAQPEPERSPGSPQRPALTGAAASLAARMRLLKETGSRVETEARVERLAKAPLDQLLMPPRPSRDAAPESAQPAASPVAAPPAGWSGVEPVLPTHDVDTPFRASAFEASPRGRSYADLMEARTTQLKRTTDPHLGGRQRPKVERPFAGDAPQRSDSRPIPNPAVAGTGTASPASSKHLADGQRPPSPGEAPFARGLPPRRPLVAGAPPNAPVPAVPGASAARGGARPEKRATVETPPMGSSVAEAAPGRDTETPLSRPTRSYTAGLEALDAAPAEPDSTGPGEALGDGPDAALARLLDQARGGDGLTRSGRRIPSKTDAQSALGIVTEPPRAADAEQAPSDEAEVITPSFELGGSEEILEDARPEAFAHVSPVVWQLMEAARRQATGELQLLAPTEAVRLFVKDGAVVRVIPDPEPRGEQLGQLLKKRGKVTEAQLAAAVAVATQRGARLGDVLVEQAGVSQRDVTWTLAARASMRLVEVAEMRDVAEMTWAEGRTLGDRQLRVGVPVPATLLRERYRQLERRTRSEAVAAEDGLEDRYVCHRVAAGSDKLRLDKREQQLWDEVLLGKYRLREIYAMSPLDRRRTHAMVFALREIGMVSLTVKPAAEHQVDELKHLFEHKAESLRNADFFDLLEVHWTGIQPEIDKAYNRTKGRFTPSPELLRPADPQTRRKLEGWSEVILKAVEEAYETLRNPYRRRTYRETFIPVNQIEFSAVHFLRQSKMAAFKEDGLEAITLLYRVLELDPGNQDALGILHRLQNRKP